MAASHAAAIWRGYRNADASEQRMNRFAAGHALRPNAFNEVRDYCWSVYVDNGSADARMLGPCLLDGVGGDFFGVVPVP